MSGTMALKATQTNTGKTRNHALLLTVFCTAHPLLLVLLQDTAVAIEPGPLRRESEPAGARRDADVLTDLDLEDLLAEARGDDLVVAQVLDGGDLGRHGLGDGARQVAHECRANAELELAAGG